MKTVFTFGGSNPWNNKAQALIELKQSDSKQALFTLSYGAQVDSGLTYSRAAKLLGESIFHHLACESELNNDGA